MLFPWYMLERQVMFIGEAHRQSPLQDLKYFHSRPRGSQIGAWTSHQSHLIIKCSSDLPCIPMYNKYVLNLDEDPQKVSTAKNVKKTDHNNDPQLIVITYRSLFSVCFI